MTQQVAADATSDLEVDEPPSDQPARDPAIGSHRLLSAGCSAALVRADAEIDWWCAPRFDAPPLLWRLLDPNGASARWRIERPLRRSDQPAGAVVTTSVQTSGGPIECRDGIVPIDDAVALVRLVRSLGSPCRATHELVVGGFDEPFASWRGDHASAGDVPLTLLGASPEPASGRLVRHVITADDAWQGFALVAGPHGVIALDELIARLDDRERTTERAHARAILPKQHPERARGALSVLEGCTYRPTGAVIASPTTSLPEVVGGDRQWDYRYCWLRDAALAVAVAARLGHRDAAERYLAFVCSLTDGDAPRNPVVSVDGDHVPDEREVTGVAGWGGSTPVRVGNEAADQTQHDAFGLVLEAVAVHLRTGGRLRRSTWDTVRTIADHVTSCTEERSNGIWEIRQVDEFVSGDIGKWLALERALSIARWHRPWTRRGRWRDARDAVRERVLGVVRDDGSMPMTFRAGDERADASALMLVIFGLLDRRDPRAAKVVDATLRELGADPFLYRYRPDGADGFAPGEGVFVPTCWWAVSALATIGRTEEAEARLDALCARLPDLLSEEFEPVDDVALGNVPLVWAHTELARSLYVLDAEQRRQRWTTAGLACWRVAHHLRLRWRRR